MRGQGGAGREGGLIITAMSRAPLPRAPLTRRRCLQALALGGLARRAGAQAQAQAHITIRLSHVVARQTPKGLALERFGELVRTHSQGVLRWLFIQ